MHLGNIVAIFPKEAYNGIVPKGQIHNLEVASMYWESKEHGYLVPETELWEDAEQMGYDDIVDPTSCEYGNFKLYYQPTAFVVK
jgi:hypothetical protein